MIEINLLPKELQIQGPRLGLTKQLLMPAAAAVLLACGMAAITFYQNNQIEELEGKIRIARARAEQLRSWDRGGAERHVVEGPQWSYRSSRRRSVTSWKLMSSANTFS